MEEDKKQFQDTENEIKAAQSNGTVNPEGDMPAEAAEEVREEISEEMPEKMPGEMPEEMPEAVSEEVSGSFNTIKEKIKKYLPFIAGGLGILIIAAIILIFAFSGKDNIDSYEQDISAEPTVSAAPTETPSPTPSPTPTPTPTPSPTPTPDPHIGEKRSEISGEWLAEETADQRPYCIMFNNIAVASPQSGIGEAAIVYEALAEAGITRLMGVFENLTEESACSDRIGSVRSARHYFASIADEYDSIFIHYGETSYASRKIEKLGMDHMDGIDGIGSTVYYRDNTIKAPHNAFATLSGILKGIEKCKFRTVKNKDTGNHFIFNEEDTDLNGELQKAEKVTLGFSSYTSPYLVYDPETKLYSRYQFGDLHIDYNTGLPLTFKNVIVQIVHEYDKDKNGYQTMDISDNSGTGYYITNGQAEKITWEKKEKTKYMVYKDENGNILSINPGKTFIAVYPDFRSEKLIFE